MFKFNQESDDKCSTCGQFHGEEHEMEQESDSGIVEYIEVDAEAEIEDAVAYFKEHVNSDKELRLALAKVYQAGYMHGIQISLKQTIEESMEALKEVQSFWDEG